MPFEWMGGFGIAPGTLIDGKELKKTTKLYNRFINSLNIIINAIANEESIPKEVYELMSKPFISPFFYKVCGSIIQIPIKNKIGRNKFYAKPLQL